MFVGPWRLHMGTRGGESGLRCLILLAALISHVDARHCERALRGTVPIAVLLHRWTSLVLFIKRLRWVLGVLRSTMHEMCSVLGSFCVVVLGVLTFAFLLTLRMAW